MFSVSVIISTYSKARSDDVISCVDSLVAQTVRPKEIILVLEPNEDLRVHYETILTDHVTILPSDGPGLSNARNSGAKKAGGDIVAFIDDDARADMNWLRNLVRNYEDPSVLAAGGLIVPVWDRGRPKWFPEELDWIVGCSYKGLPEHRACVRNAIGCNMSFRKEVFAKIGYFKTDFGRLGRELLGSEETELSIRLLRYFPNSKLIYDPAAVVYHGVPESRKQMSHFIKRSFYEGVSKRLLERLESRTPDPLRLEKRYLTYVLTVAIPSRIERMYSTQNFLQIVVLGLSISLVAVGYFAGNLFPRPKEETN